MKTSEFIKKVNEMGYKINVDMYSINVHRENGIIAMVAINKSKKLDTLWDEYMTDDLFDVCVEYAKTPIEERKDVKKYYLYHEALNGYFNYHKIDKYYFWGSVHQTINVQTMFTEEQIENNKFRDIMLLLEKVEVE